ncbi:MAG: hypothetical protein FWH10_06320 [Oscillospiraceae bacterium]|nr:hypothetical protein [Oscillospiraceae bacterium]
MKTKFKKSKRVIIIAAFIILCFIFISCSPSDGGGENIDGGLNNYAGGRDNPGEDGSGINGAEPEETKALRETELPEKNYGGYDFRFLVKEFNDGGYWGAVDIYAAEENGDPINDMVYKRNRIIEDRYNISISEVRSDDIPGNARRSILVSSHDYDVIMPDLNGAAPLAAQGIFLDARSELPFLQLDGVWWDQRANRMLSLADRQYFLIGDMTLMANDATWVIMFNKKVTEEYGLGSLYSHVKEDNWTFDTFFGLVRSVSKDLNGDGIIDMDDQLGLLTDNGAKTILVYNTGEMAARKDGNDLPYLSLNTERTIDAARRVFEVLADKTISINAHESGDFRGIPDPWTDGANRMFQENRGLFYMISLTVMHRMRGMDSDFGVLPSPKLDGSQGEYYHTVQPSTTNSILFPNTSADPEMASIIIEDMCYESRDTVRHAYFDTTITNKTIRDEESAEMLDLIFSTRIYDLGFIFNWGNIGYLLESVYPDAGRFVSRYETAEPRARTQMERTLDEIAGIS